MLGGILLENAVSRRMNVMLETSGKDIASFHYVNFSSQTAISQTSSVL